MIYKFEIGNKFEIGDRVQVLPYDQLKGKDTAPTFVEEMEKYCGKNAEISDIDDTYENDTWYCIDIDRDNYSFREEWLEPAEPEFQLGEELFLI